MMGKYIKIKYESFGNGIISNYINYAVSIFFRLERFFLFLRIFQYVGCLTSFRNRLVLCIQVIPETISTGLPN